MAAGFRPIRYSFRLLPYFFFFPGSRPATSNSLTTGSRLYLFIYFLGLLNLAVATIWAISQALAYASTFLFKLSPKLELEAQQIKQETSFRSKLLLSQPKQIKDMAFARWKSGTGLRLRFRTQARPLGSRPSLIRHLSSRPRLWLNLPFRQPSISQLRVGSAPM